jgi:hypothetical protein
MKNNKNNMNNLFAMLLEEVAELYFYNEGEELNNELDQLLSEAGLPVNIDRDKSSRDVVYVNMFVDDKNKSLTLYPDDYIYNF